LDFFFLSSLLILGEREKEKMKNLRNLVPKKFVIPPLPPPPGFVDPKIEWPKQIHKENLEKFKSGEYIEYLSKNMSYEKSYFFPTKNKLYVKFDFFLSSKLLHHIKKYFVKIFPDPRIKIVVYFSNVFIKRKYAPFTYEKKRENVSFFGTNPQVVTVHHTYWWIYCYKHNPINFWEMKSKKLSTRLVRMSLN